ncbi:ANKRD17 [Symbiodinium sp. CCMP2456]|nr:ANKRD17 [Symbiodinium sp. CCMP2456]
MAGCASWSTPTPLEIYARSLPHDADAAAMLFPMYTVSVDVLLEMTKVEPHEELKARGELTVFSDDLGRAAFVSHQWLAADHPDHDFKQMRGLQDAVKRLRCGRGSVSLDQVTESYVRTAKPIPMHEFQVQALFLWYDYFSCPQLEQRVSFGAETDGSQQASAINSIPAYVAKCRFFLALCPVLDCPFEGKVLTAATWSRRGWCRLERAARELSRNSSWILIRSDTSMEVVGTVLSFPSAAVGEGDFTVADDRQKLAPVMRQILVQKLSRCLRAGDLPGFRRHFNLQAVHLRGLEIDPVGGLLQRSHGDSAEFLHQNGLRRVDDADAAGWRPLHYAALAGNTTVLKGLLELRADLNRRTSKDEPVLGFPAWTSVLEIATFYKHHEATRWLLAARARLGGGRTGSPIAFAAISDNEEGIRLLCMAGLKPLAHNLFGHTNLEAAASYAAFAALEELVLQGRPNPLELSRALWGAATFRGGSAELVLHLIELRADINFQFKLSRDYRPLGRLFVGVKSLQHRLGSASIMTAFAYHLHGSTPLMQAVKSAQFEAAAALIAGGARLDLRNCRNWAAADFARGQSIPRFLQLGFQGDASECRRVSSLAMADGYVEVPF